MIAASARIVGVLMAIGLFVLWGGQAEAQSARISKLNDVSFGMLSSTASDVTNSQSVCAFASGLSNSYSMRASGSGTGGALTLAGSGSAMAYEVQWAATPNQTSGTALPANTTVGGVPDGLATLINSTCTLGLSTSASLIVIVRAAALSTATAGSYSGTLTLVIAPQ